MTTKVDIEGKYLQDLEIWRAAGSEPALQYLIDAQQSILDQAMELREKVGESEGDTLDLEGWDLALNNYQQRLNLYRQQPELAVQPFLYGYGEVRGQVIDEPDIQMSGMLFNDLVDLAPKDVTWADQIRARALEGLQGHYEKIARGANALIKLKDPLATAYEQVAKIATRAAQAAEAYAAGEIRARAKSRAIGNALGLGLGITAATFLLIAAGKGKLRLPK